MSAGRRFSARFSSLILLAVLVFALGLASVLTGPARIPTTTVFHAIEGLVRGRPAGSTLETIVVEWRLPSAATAAMAGAALALAGLQMQTLFRNPLAGPDVLGVTAGASLGVAVVVLSGGGPASDFLPASTASGPLALVFAASIGAAVVLLLVLAVARSVHDSATLLILGLMFAALTSSAVGLLITFSTPDRLQSYIRWTLGRFNDGSWPALAVLAPTLFVAGGAVVASAKTLNALHLGEDYSRSVGVRLRWSQTLFLASSATLAGAVTAFCGPVAFIGVATPHLTRALLRTADHRWLLPGSALLGAAVALAVEIIAKSPQGESEVTLPINSVSGLLGAPVVVWVVLRQRRPR